MKKFLRQLGQGMTEYIIIVALIAIAAIAAYSFFGESLRSQVGGIATELSGGDGTAAQTQAATKAAQAVTEGGTYRGLDDYTTGSVDK
jgi:Flp pilus assembly pilin Flp